MEIKWFFVGFGILFTIILLSGQLFIGTYLSDQDRKHFEANQNRSATVLDKLNPILDIIPNATQAHIDQQVHYNETHDIIAIFKSIINNNDTIVPPVPEPVPDPSPVVDNVTDPVPVPVPPVDNVTDVIENVTDPITPIVDNVTDVIENVTDPIVPVVDNVTDVIVENVTNGNVTDGNNNVTDDRGGDVPIPGPLEP